MSVTSPRATACSGSNGDRRGTGVGAGGGGPAVELRAGSGEAGWDSPSATAVRLRRRGLRGVGRRHRPFQVPGDAGVFRRRGPRAESPLGAGAGLGHRGCGTHGRDPRVRAGGEALAAPHRVTGPQPRAWSPTEVVF